MQRRRSATGKLNMRQLILFALPAAILIAIAGIVLFHTQRTLSRAGLSAASARQAAFTLHVLDATTSRVPGPGFAAVAFTPSYTAGVFLGGSLYLAGPGGLSIFAPGGNLRTLLRTGVELPVAPVVALVTGRPRNASEPELLIATAGAGLLLLEPGEHAAPTLRDLLPSDPELRDLTSVLQLPSGDILLGTRRRGLLVYNGQTLTPLAIPNADAARLQITALAAVDASTFLIGTRNRGVIYAHAGIFTPIDASGGLPDDQVESIAIASRRAYIGTPMGVADFDLDAPSFRPARTLAAGLFSHSLNASETELTVGTLDQGIQRIPLNPEAHLHRASIAMAQSNPSTERIDAFLGTAGDLYALADGKLLRRTGSTWIAAIPTAAATLTDRNISALAFAPDGTLYVGYFDRGLDLLTQAGNVHHLEDDHLFCINRLVLDPSRQTIDAATADGLVLFDAQGNPRQTLNRRDGLISDHVTDIAFTPSGTALATPAGLTFIGPSGTESLYAFQGLVNNHVYALASANGELLAGTLGGLSILHGNAVQRNLTIANSGLKHNWITALLAASDGTTLVGTYGAGIQTLDREGRFAPIELPAGTPHDLVINPNALYATSNHLYAGTLNHGLLVYSTTSGRWSNLTAGLPSLNITAFAARNGQVYIGTENGLVRIADVDLP
jgi:ligand-binding sensor domain-containing protein